MKELSIEEKAKAYDEAIERLRNAFYDNNSRMCEEYRNAALKIIEPIFPELKESEDERIRKALIDFLEYYRLNNVLDSKTILLLTDSVAWLENQGEQKSINNQFTPEQASILDKHIDKFLEQKFANDWAMPKFKDGDWVVDKNGIVKKILSYNNGVYKHTDGYSAKIFEDEWRLWDITKDAKNGDVLCSESGWTCIFKDLDNLTNTFSSYCFMDNDKWFCNIGSECHTLDKTFIKAYNGEIHPATKEQYDTLMKAMTDAGYTFDFEKKELKNIEQEKDMNNKLTDFEYSLKNIMEEAIECGDTHNLKADADMLLRLAQKSTEWHREDEQNLNACLGYIRDEFLRRWLKDIIHTKYDKSIDKVESMFDDKI